MSSSKQSAKIYSMTGFASARGSVAGRRFLVESKSVNHRFCEINIRLPGKFASWEIPLQKLFRTYFQRGRIDIFVKEESGGSIAKTDVDQIKLAHRELKKIAKELKLADEFSLETILSFKQNYFRNEDVVNIEKEWKNFEVIAISLAEKLQKMRLQEGRALQKWFKGQLPILDQLIRELMVLVKAQTKNQAGYWQQRMEELGFKELEGEKRISAELSLLTEKLDVTEELVRLQTHLKAFKSMLMRGGVIGRKIDFLMQEVGREINTVASKSQDSSIAALVVDFKTEIEKIREQAGNVE